MSARILDGNRISAEIKSEVAAEVAELRRLGTTPGLAVVLAGDDPASEIYVRNKVRACEQLGIYSEKITPPPSAGSEELLAIVKELNRREDIDGILVQLPLPAHVASKRLLLAVSPEKDVDGFHPVNVGLLSTGREGLFPCTPSGVMEMLRRSAIPPRGKHAVVIGRSDIVGKPMAMLLLNADCTVTICHRYTHDLRALARQADIIVAAVGQPGLVTREYVKPGAVVIDVGINKLTSRQEFDRFFKGDARREEQFAAKGSTIVGDVHPNAAETASAITPVPGGVGPLTIAMLMANTVKAARLRRGIAAADFAETAPRG